MGDSAEECWGFIDLMTEAQQHEGSAQDVTAVLARRPLDATKVSPARTPSASGWIRSVSAPRKTGTTA
jgi:hypothetical protein